MENGIQEKKTKSNDKKANYGTLRLKRDCYRKLLSELEKINDKNQGRRVRPDELIAHLLTFLTEDGRRYLRESAMSNQDLFERDFQEYCAAHQKISRDEYLGLIRKLALPALNGKAEEEMV